MQYHMDQKSLKVQFLTLQNPTIQKGKKKAELEVWVYKSQQHDGMNRRDTSSRIHG